MLGSFVAGSRRSVYEQACRIKAGLELLPRTQLVPTLDQGRQQQGRFGGARMDKRFRPKMFDNLDGEIENFVTTASSKLRPEADSHVFSLGGWRHEVWNRDRLPITFGNHQVSAPAMGFQEVHLRAADEARDKEVVGIIIKLKRTANLFDAAITQDYDFGCKCHGLDLVMSGIDDRSTEVFMQFRDFHAHVDTKFGIEVRQRLIEEEKLWCLQNGPPDGDTLALAA